MNTLAAGFALGVPSEVAFDAVVSTPSRFFFGARPRAEHEAFDVRTADGRSLEIVDNVLLAPPVPVVPGDRVHVVGELVPRGSRGPLVHWTHHDPAGVHADGSIELNGKRYA